MNKGVKITLGLGILTGLGLFVWSKIGQAKNLVQNLVFSPMWYGGINDMQLDFTKGMKLPLAVDIENRSDMSATVKINSFDVVNGEGTTIARSSSGTDEVEISADSVSRMKIDVWITSTTLYSLLGAGISSFIAGNADSIKNKAMELVDGCTFQITLTANSTFTATISIDMNGGEVTVSGIDGLGLVCAENRQIASISEYKHLLPPESWLKYRGIVRIENVKPEQTAEYIRGFAQRHKNETTLLSEYLRGTDTESTVQNIWNFVARYIKYTKDDDGCEELRTPLRTLYDQMGDCDCYSALIASICENLNLPYDIRIAEYYNRGYYQHVYIIIDGYVCDPVIDRCFKEKQYTDKRDF